jgi:hypothetical protein
MRGLRARLGDERIQRNLLNGTPLLSKRVFVVLVSRTVQTVDVVQMHNELLVREDLHAGRRNDAIGGICPTSGTIPHGII